MDLENKIDRSKPNFFKRIARKAMPYVFAASLMAAVAGCPSPVPPTPDYTVEKEVIGKAGDRLIDLQNANGSWDWAVTNKTGPTATTYLNIAGATGMGLLDTYKVTGEAKYLDAAIKTGDYIVAQVGALPAERHFNAFNMVFLQELADVSKDVTYSNFVATKMNDLRTKVTYWKDTSHNISTDGNPGLTAAELVAAEEVIRGTAVDGIKPWDLYHFVQLAKEVGYNPYATGVANGIKNYVEASGYVDTVPDYELGLAGAVIGLKKAGLNYNPPLTKLLEEQESDGHFETQDPDFAVSKIQATAYALMALADAGKSAEAKKASDYLVNNFGYGTTPHFDGWLESDGDEYAEADSEAAQAIYDYIE